MKIMHDDLFPTRIFLVDNLLEEEYVDSMKKDIMSSSRKTPGKNWQSQPRLQNEKKYQALVEKIKLLSEKYMSDMRWDVEQYQITDMWSNILKPGETHRPHTHSNNVLSGVFYIKAKKHIKDTPDSAAIQFYDPRPQSKILAPRCHQHTKENSSIWFYPSVTNRLLIFPSWLEHYVPINMTKENRISISWNIMFKGQIGVPEEFQSAVF